MAAAEPVVNVSLAAKQYVAAGLVLVAFDKGSKGPHHIGWNKRENCIDSLAQASNLYGNIGLAHAYSRTCCIDIDAMPLAVAWFAGVGIDLEGLWNAPDAVRMSSGRLERGKLVYALPKGTPLLRTRMFKGDGVELRCATAAGLTVQDVLPPSTHPLTGQAYRWIGPGDWRDIPAIPRDLLAFWQALTAPRETNAAGRPTAAGLGREDIEAALAQIKPELLDYDDWLHVGMALHHECSGNEVGLDLWDQWSAGGGKKYRGRGELESKWPGFSLEHEHPRTLRSVMWLAGPVDMTNEYQPIADDVAPAAAPAEAARGVLRVQPVALASLLCAPPEPAIVVENLMLMDACGFVAPGGTGKTTLAIYEAIHIILGRPLWGRQVMKAGRVLFLTAEDSRLIVTSRLNHICQALGLSAAELECVADGLYIEDLSVSGGRLVGANPKTGAIQATALTAHLIERYRDLGVSLVHLDPASLLGPGEQSGNDGMSELMRVARQISAALQAACQIVHHVAQVVARTGIQDQYAGRGGTAFADGSRGQRQLVRIRERNYEFDGRKYRLPESVSDDDFERGRVLAILVHKLSYVELVPSPIFIRRRGFGFEQFEAECLSPRGAQSTEEQTQVLIGVIERDRLGGVYHSISTLELRAKDLAMTQKRIRDLLKAALDLGSIFWATTPKSEGSKGGKTKHLAVAEDVTEDL